MTCRWSGPGNQENATLLRNMCKLDRLDRLSHACCFLIVQGGAPIHQVPTLLGMLGNKHSLRFCSNCVDSAWATAAVASLTAFVSSRRRLQTTCCGNMPMLHSEQAQLLLSFCHAHFRATSGGTACFKSVKHDKYGCQRGRKPTWPQVASLFGSTTS